MSKPYWMEYGWADTAKGYDPDDYSNLSGLDKSIVEGAGAIFNGLTGITSAQATYAANERNIANQNYWNEIAMQREDTAHQREVADLQAAGLNPWLSMGNGAQSTALSTAQAEPVDGSKILSATSAMALLAITKLLLKK